MTQEDLIVIHQQLKQDSESCDCIELRAHYEHILMGLERLIESHGPTELYQHWLIQFRPHDLADERTFFIDL